MATETNSSLQPGSSSPKRRGRPRGAVALDASLRRNAANIATALADKAAAGDAEALASFLQLAKLAGGRND